jgi:hypothetical protein
MKYASSLVVLVVGLVAGAAATYLALQDRKPPEPPPPVAVVDKAPQLVAVSRLQIDDHEKWQHEGFVEMVPPMKLPTNGTGRDQIHIWLKVPDGKKITARKLPDGSASIRFPTGTVADRVESFGRDGPNGSLLWTVGDVRGTTLVSDGELFHVYVPIRDEDRAPLIGWEWKRGDAAQQRASTTLLARQIKSAPWTSADGRIPNLQQLVDSYTKNNQCDRCHIPNKPETIEIENAIHRRTDDVGWFVPLAVLSDRMPLESHRPRDQNSDDPFTTVECPGGEPPALEEGQGGARRVRCPKGGSPVGFLDVKKALAAKDARAIGLCASRKYLFDRMEPEARALFDVFSECGLR